MRVAWQRRVVLRRLLAHLTPSMVVALLALSVALGGTATAATYVITKRSQIAPEVRAQLKGAVAKAGAAGPAGPAGPVGATGPKGATGAAGASPAVGYPNYFTSAGASQHVVKTTAGGSNFSRCVDFSVAVHAAVVSSFVSGTMASVVTEPSRIDNYCPAGQGYDVVVFDLDTAGGGSTVQGVDQFSLAVH